MVWIAQGNIDIKFYCVPPKYSEALLITAYRVQSNWEMLASRTLILPAQSPPTIFVSSLLVIQIGSKRPRCIQGTLVSGRKKIAGFHISVLMKNLNKT
jgi:hypothetical protein